MHYIYLITNTINGKLYVGQTTLTPEQRLREHIYSKLKQDYFHAAIRKHGKTAFVVEELGRYETQEETNDAERFWILRLNTCNNNLGYNATYGGDYGGIPNEATRAKIGAASSQRRHTSETRQAMSEAHSGEKNHFFGKRHKTESIEIMKSKLKIALGGENNPWFGRTLSEEHRLNISKAKTGKKLPPRSEETRRKLSEAATARWAKVHESQLTANIEVTA